MFVTPMFYVVINVLT